jgi:hypothetical protein
LFTPATADGEQVKTTEVQKLLGKATQEAVVTWLMNAEMNVLVFVMYCFI